MTNVLELINNQFSRNQFVQRNRRAVFRSNIASLDVIYVITWKNLHFYSADSNQVNKNKINDLY
jgi:hypothetical protein